MILRLRILWICLFIACPVLMYAQESSAKRYREQHYFDMALAGAEREIFNGAFLEPFAWHRKEKAKTPDRVWVAIHKLYRCE